MCETAGTTDPALWGRVKDEVTAGAKGGKRGQWSARRALLAVAECKRRGGGYEGQRDADNSLHQWTEEEWGRKSGKRSADSGERYLPKEARATLFEAEYARTSAWKRADTKKGRQLSAQPDDVAAKTATVRDRRTRD